MDALDPFEYSKLNESDIRLLSFNPSEDRFAYNLQHYSSQEAPEFFALSYVWGIDAASEAIECNGKRLLITPRLLACLKALQLHFGSTSFWIDAICLNQADNVEKAIQVPRMTEIYSAAKRVLIWFGPEQNGSDRFLENLPRMKETLLKQTSLVAIDKNTMVAAGLPSIEDTVWAAVLSLARREWFSRVWIIQEAILARSILVQCGSKIVEFDELVGFYNLLRETQLTDDAIYEHKIDFSTGVNGIALLAIISGLRSWLANGTKIRLKVLLDISRRSQATEHIDKVYGMMGLMDEDTRCQITADYSLESRRDFWKVYTDIGKIHLKQFGLTLLDGTPSDQRHPDLPSWCPDFRYETSQNSLGLSYSAGMAESDEDWSAQLESVIVKAGSPVVTFRGLRMDKVNEVVNLTPKAITNLERSARKAALVLKCEEECSALSRKIFDFDKEVPTEYITTLVTGLHADRSFYPSEELREDYKNTMKWYQFISDGNLNAPEFKHPDFLVSVARYRSAMSIAWQGAVFFSTEGGHIGIGEKSLQQGDEICVFFGAHVPYVLRRNADGVFYTFVGAAYVSGLMTGEAFKSRNPRQKSELFDVK
jgi:hypothetical protein